MWQPPVSQQIPNGRINFNREMGVSGSAAALPGFGYRTKMAASEADDAIRGNVMANDLNRAFFSQANVQILQNKIRREVYDRSGGEFLVDEQSVDTLLIIMRAMYLQYGKNQPTHIKEQIVELNQLVADYAVPDIVSACSMDRQYLHDITHMPVPMAQPIALTQKGTKSSSFDRFF
jgi:Family of unknown function (DUF5761)